MSPTVALEITFLISNCSVSVLQRVNGCIKVHVIGSHLLNSLSKLTHAEARTYFMASHRTPQGSLS